MHNFDSENFYAFVIPNSNNHGAQNFFRRLYKYFDSKNKLLIIENDETFLKNFIKLSKISKKENLKLITTVNSNKLGLFFKILHPNVDLISRLGNTVSQEIMKFTPKFFFHKFFYFLLIIFSKKIIFQSAVMLDDFVSFFNFTKNSDKFCIIHNGIEMNSHPSSYNLNKFNVSKTHFLLVGSFKYQKGYDVFFNSLELLTKDLLKSSHFHICGDGDLLESYKQLVVNSIYKESISFYGAVDPTPFYKKCDVYILPSRFEGFSNSLIEALSFGLPAILADCPSANKDVVKDSLNGVFFVNEDQHDLSKKIVYMKKNFLKFDKAAIQEDVVKRFSIRKIALIYKKLFE